MVLALGCLLASGSVHALTQPDGTPIPVKKSNPSEDLQSIFTAQGDPIDVLKDAAVMPETFDPTCNLTFTMISRGGAGFQNVFGWYNVTGAAPPASDLHVLIPCTAQPPQAFPLNIKTDPAYKGGKIGFFMITPENQASSCASTSNVGYVYYSERKWNPDMMGASSYIHLITYDSKKLAKSFYFTWEDLYGGGDNEFTDLVTRVDGIACAGGGAPCDTGKKGICAAGTMQCQSGKLVCVQQTMPGAATCNGLDNDCNGTVDTNCAGSKVCDKGQCLPKCGTGEFTCQGGASCNADGFCVEPPCVGVMCSAGKVCVGGACVGPCDGVVCPHGTICTAAGACVDPCAGVTCDKEQICDAGACVDKCGCGGCPTGKTCAASGACVATACAMKTCAAGQICAADGTCQDACAGAKCPGGGACVAGVCGPPMTGAGGGGGMSGLGGSGGGVSALAGGAGGKSASAGGAGGKSASVGGNGGKSVGGNGGGLVAPGADPGAAPATGGGCGCRTAPSGQGSLLLLALAPLFARRRRAKLRARDALPTAR